MRESIGAEGVAQPVVIHHSGEHPEGVMLAQGHHRVASATVANPEQLVPVKHYGPDYQFKEAVHEREYVKYGGLASLRSEPF